MRKKIAYILLSVVGVTMYGCINLQTKTEDVQYIFGTLNAGLFAEMNWEIMRYNLDSAYITFHITGDKDKIDSILLKYDSIICSYDTTFLLNTMDHYQYRNLSIMCDGHMLAQVDTLPAEITIPVGLLKDTTFNFVQNCQFDTLLTVPDIVFPVTVHKGEIVDSQHVNRDNGGTNIEIAIVHTTITIETAR